MRASWEVCLKHRNIRRVNPAGASSSLTNKLEAEVFVLFCQMARLDKFGLRLLRSSFKSRIPECQSGDAGANPAGRTNFQTAGVSCAVWSPKPGGLGAAPRRRAIFRC